MKLLVFSLSMLFAFSSFAGRPDVLTKLAGRSIVCDVDQSMKSGSLDQIFPITFKITKKGSVVVEGKEIFDDIEADVSISNKWIDLGLVSDATIEHDFHIRYESDSEADVANAVYQKADAQAGGQSLAVASLNCSLK